METESHSLENRKTYDIPGAIESTVAPITPGGQTMATEKPVKPAQKKAAKKKKGPHARYSDNQKTELLDKYHELKKSGKKAPDAAKEVGVSYPTLLAWEKKTGRKASKRGRIPAAKPVPVGQVRAGKTGTMALVTPDGYRFEASNPKDLIQILKGLRG